MVIMERTKVYLSVIGVLLVCATSLASVHGGWSAWRDSTPCSSSCGYSTRNQIRTCDNPAPARRGRNCIGPSSKTIRCRVPASCPRDDRRIGYEAGSSWSSLVPQPGQSIFSSDTSIPVPEVIQTTAKAPEEIPFSSVGSMSTFESHVQPIEVIQTTAEIYEAGPSWSSLVPQPGQTPSEESPFSFDDSSFGSNVRPIEVIQTTGKAPEESAFSSVSSETMFEVLARFIEVNQTPAEVENHSGFGSAGGKGNITYENVHYTIRKQLIHVDSSGGHTMVSTA